MREQTHLATGADVCKQAVAPGGKVTGTSGQQGQSGYTGYTAPKEQEEPEPIR